MEDFVPFEIAKKLKEKGFRMSCIAHYCCLDGNVLKFNITADCIRGSNFKVLNEKYNIYIDAPTISQVLKWLREEKRWVIVVRLYSTNGWCWFVQDKNGELKSSHLASCDDCFATYELTALAGIEYCLDNLI